MSVMMYSFWDKPDQTPVAAAIVNWRSFFPQFKVIGDTDIEAMIEDDFPQYLDLYRHIRIPTCKSDVAILLSLWRHGGLYVDIHCGVVDAAGVLRMVEELSAYEIILYSKDLRKEPRPAEVLRPLNSVIVARPGTGIMRRSIEMAFANLDAHWQAERATPEFVPYDIWSLTGPGVLEHTVCIPPLVRWEPPLGLRPENEGKVKFVQEGPGAPIRRYLFHTYNPPGTHWSKRQQNERLFRSGGASD